MVLAEVDIDVGRRIFRTGDDPHRAAGLIGDLGDDIDDAAHGIGPIEGARRAADDFDAFNIAQIEAFQA